MFLAVAYSGGLGVIITPIFTSSISVDLPTAFYPREKVYAPKLWCRVSPDNLAHPHGSLPPPLPRFAEWYRVATHPLRGGKARKRLWVYLSFINDRNLVDVLGLDLLTNSMFLLTFVCIRKEARWTQKSLVS